MNTAEAIIKVVMATASYLYKYRPYMTVWVICCIGGGVYESIETHNAASLAACIVFMLVPVAIKKVLLTISRIGGEYNEYDEKLLGRGPKGRFINYIEKYLKKR